MADPYVGEIRLFAGNFAPLGWAFCDGAVLPISENETLFNLIGTIYGGDGQQTFALPDLRGRVPLHQGTDSWGTSHQPGEQAGVEEVTLTVPQIPSHNHAVLASAGPGTTDRPAGELLATPPTVRPYVVGTPDVTMAPSAVGPTGGSQPHENRQPFLAVNFIISLSGSFPTPS